MELIIKKWWFYLWTNNFPLYCIPNKIFQCWVRLVIKDMCMWQWENVIIVVLVLPTLLTMIHFRKGNSIMNLPSLIVLNLIFLLKYNLAQCISNSLLQKKLPFWVFMLNSKPKRPNKQPYQQVENGIFNIQSLTHPQLNSVSSLLLVLILLAQKWNIIWWQLPNKEICIPN